jgi:hypothetical protein
MNQSKTAGNVALMVMGLVFLCIGGVLGGFGVLYILAAHAADAGDPGARLSIGIGMLVLGLLIWSAAGVGGFLAWRRMQPKRAQQVTVHQEVDLTGDIDLASLRCDKCGAALDEDAVRVKEGTVMVACPYCGAAYQVVEEPKW